MKYLAPLSIAVVVCISVLQPAWAQETQECAERELVQAGTFEAVGKSVGILVGARWGSGVMTLNDGTTHWFSFKGAKLLDIGASETRIVGTVYNLDSIEDFPGIFLGIGGGLAAVTKALGGMSITNGKCVVLNGRAGSAEGVRLTNPLGPGGVRIALDD